MNDSERVNSMKKNRLVIAAWILAMLTASFSGCSRTEMETEKESDASNVETELTTETLDYYDSLFTVVEDDLGDLVFDGETFTILTPGTSTWWHLIQMDFDLEEIAGDVLFEAVHYRTLNVAERLNIDIQTYSPVDVVQFLSAARDSILAGDHAYDAMYGVTDTFIPLATEKQLYDLDALPYINLNKEYWDQNAKEQMRIGGKLYCMLGDSNMFYNDSTWILMFSKDMAAEYALEDPYQLVRDGKWTWDVYYSMSDTVTTDLNGDGKMDTEDRWGTVTNWNAVDAMLYGTGEKLIRMDNGENYVFEPTERFYSVMEDLCTMFRTDGIIYEVYSHGKADDVTPEMLDSGKTLFASEVLQCVRRYRATELNFGILPIPKYDENQENYCSYSIQPYLSPAFVPASMDLSRAELTGATLEALSSESRKTLKPVYFKTALESKYFRDEESGEMLEIIFSNKTFELETVSNLGISNILQQYTVSKADNLASTLAKNQNSIMNKLNQIISSEE